jgi:hypothetical protein
MATITFQDALIIAEKFLNDLQMPLDDDDMMINGKKCVEVANGWIFFYNSKGYLESGDKKKMLVGNGPLYVDDQGRLTQLPTFIPWQEALLLINAPKAH